MSETSLNKLEKQYDVSEKHDGEIELDVDAGESIELPEMTERLAKVAAAFMSLVNKDVIVKGSK
jgi:hypothetical protein